MPTPKIVYIHFSQHQGRPAQPIVRVGEKVKIGTKLGEPDGEFSASIHSSVAGRIVSIEEYPHPVLGKDLCCIIESSEDEWQEDIREIRNYENLTRKELVEIIRDKGIVGLGGGMFPTHIKISPPPDKRMELLIINGCESEPLLASDYRLMMDFPEGIVEGAKIYQKILGANRLILAIQKGKSEVKDRLKKEGIEVVVLKNYFPMGAEKLLIKTITKREIPQNLLPWDIGCIVLNVATCYAGYQAVKFNKPLIERVITVAGDGVCQSKILRVKIGTRIKEIIDYCGGYKERVNKIVMGGPMTGISQFTDSVPIIKGISGLIILSRIFQASQRVCVRCGSCVDSCPMGLLPVEIYKALMAKDIEKAKDLGVLTCLECGLCTYYCPSHIPLVHYFKLARYKLRRIQSQIYE